MYSIGINAQLLSGEAGYRRAGIHHYIAQILRHLPADERLRYLVFSEYRAQGTDPGLAWQEPPWPTGNRFLRILWEQTAWPLTARRQNIDLLHSTAFVTPMWAPCPTVVTVYDLSFIEYPDRFPPLQRLYLTSQTRRSCRQSRRVVAIADAGRDDIQRLLGVPAERIDVVRPGVGQAFRPLSSEAIAAFRRRKKLPDQFVLHVGTLQPRKNIPVLIEAMTRLKSHTLPLVLVGGKGWLYDEIFARVETLGLQDRVRFAGYVPDEELPLWYNAASMLVFPSLYEGFGLPVIQAMACGTPVIAADTSAVPEAAGEAALLFAPQDVDCLSGHISTIVENSDLVASMRQAGLRHAAQHSWTIAGEEMANVYRRALVGPSTVVEESALVHE